MELRQLRYFQKAAELENITLAEGERDLEETYRKNIRYYCLVMSENYIKHHFDDIKAYANVIENRLGDDCTMAQLMQDNARVLALAKAHKVNYVLIDDAYEINL